MEEIASPSSQGSDPNKADANAQHDDEMEQEQVPRREVDKTRAIVVEIRRMKGNQKGPLNKTIKMKIRFDDPTTRKLFISLSSLDTSCVYSGHRTHTPPP